MPAGRSRKSESGSILIILMIGAAVAAIMLATASQSWSTAQRRDKEEELIFRGEQYVYALIAYRKDHNGQVPTNLEDLFKPGPRGLRYIRKLYPDPLAKDGRWGLLYLMPGGRGVYDPVAAQKAAQGQAGMHGATPGVTGLNPDPLGTGVPGTGGPVPGAPPLGQPPPPGSQLPLSTPALGEWGKDPDDKSISEQPLGWPIVGVISRVTGFEDAVTFKIFKGHTEADEWQFHVFDHGAQLPQQPGTGARAVPQGVGPGFGGISPISGIGGPGGARPGRGRGGLFPGAGGRGRQGGPQRNQPGQQNPRGGNQNN